MTYNLSKKLESFFLSNTLWMFSTMLLFISLMRVKEIRPPSFFKYWELFFIYSVLFLPVLLYSGFRQGLKRHLNKYFLAVLWLFSFVLYPLLLSFFPVEQCLDIPWGGYFVPVVGLSLLASEMGIQANNFIKKSNFNQQWRKRLSLDGILLLFLLLLALILIALDNTFQQQYASLGYWIGFSGQFFGMLLIYYFFYYFNNKVLVPKLLKPMGIVPYGFGFIAILLLLYPIAGELIIALPFLDALNWPLFGHKNVFYEDNHIIIPMAIILLSVPFILVMEWFKSNNKIAELEKEKSNTELSFLKQQINPHFFFNTLNNLYALSLTKDKQTPEVVLQLAELMRYVIYKGKEDWVLLKEEIKYIEDYIELQQIRLHKPFDFQFEKDILDENVKIPPLLFITFVENAFKHGIEPAEKACFLHLYLKVDDRDLRFVCNNSFERQTLKKEGIGLKNLKRRLALRFATKHKVEIEKEKGIFKAVLEIKLT